MSSGWRTASTGAFVASVSGSAQQPIFLCGPRGALENEGPRSGYVLHLKQASHWRLIGFSVRQGQKGVMADGTVGSVIQGLNVTDIGDEAIHLRNFSTDNVVSDNEISRTGLRREKFGEGVYIGTAVSNWCTISNCRPDRSDRNVVVGNRIDTTTAEAVDIKEGTTGGLVQDNVFDGSALSGADSWVDVKGTAWLIQGNTGTASPRDGFQTHEILEGWGSQPVPRQPGDRQRLRYGFALTPSPATPSPATTRPPARPGPRQRPLHVSLAPRHPSRRHLLLAGSMTPCRRPLIAGSISTTPVPTFTKTESTPDSPHFIRGNP